MDTNIVTALIDNKPPKIKIDDLYKPQLLSDEAKRVMEIDKENMELLKNINIINRSKAEVDNDNEICKSDYKLINRDKDNMKLYKQNLEMYNKIRETVAMYSYSALMEDWKKNKLIMKKNAKHPLSFTRKPKKSSITKFRKSQPHHQKMPLLKIPRFPPRQRCFFELKISETNRKLGKIVFELYDDVVPVTCRNFMSFCIGYNGLSYKNTPFHRIIMGYMCQGGDVTKLNGIGGTSIYGDTFEDENFELIHSGPGVLSMSRNNNLRDSNDSKFNLTFRSLRTLDGKNVVFGKVVRGLETIYRLEELGTKTGKPKKKVIISNCGVC